MKLSQLKEKISSLINKPLNEIEETGGSQPCYIVKAEGHIYFVKSTTVKNDNLIKEATGLKKLLEVYPNTPKIHYSDREFLIIAYIQREEPSAAYWKQLGENLANMHKKTQSQFGFYEDNWIGLSEQKNLTSTEAENNAGVFFWENRIQFKLEQLEANKTPFIDTDKKDALKEKVIEQLNYRGVVASPLHGDLWGGNILCGQGAQAYLIDPAFYYGDRESDLAMTECFGGFSELFYQTYNKALPLSEGYQERKHIFNLYHMLNHSIIFGDNYKNISLDLIEKILSS